jgi:phosphate ABC transporter phosphate-binding protein
MRHRSRLARGLLLTTILASLGLAAAMPAQADASHALINGSGSGWSANAVNQWIADVQSNGLQVVFTASGSAIGRKDFGYRTNDFAVSDIGFQGVDPVTGDQDTSQGRSFAYLPIVAGGTSFPYQIRVSGQLVRNLRLSGETLAKIFTNQITNWNDPAITKDNNGRRLPSIPIIPVVHSEGSGSTAQFTRYLDTMYPNVWRPYAGASGLTEYYPRKGKMIAQSGSDGVINYVTSAAANGAIGYDEYSYALAKDYPVAKILNKAGYYTLPTQYNVAVALTQAQINKNKKSPDYLLQDLNKVYTYGDKRTYPLSSYSYAIIPTASNDKTMTTAKRQTLADYLYYSICQGQREIGPIGYSPLPINLVEASFQQVGMLKKADSKVDLTKRNVSTCDNPTFVAGQPNRNYLAEIAPNPPACDRVGAGPCSGDAGTNNQNPDSSGNPSGGGTSNGGTKSGGTNSGGTNSGGTNSGGTKNGGTGGTQAVDPITGQPIGSTDPGTGGSVAAVPTELSAFSQPKLMPILAGLAVLLIVAAIAVPPLLNRRLSKPASKP